MEADEASNETLGVLAEVGSESGVILEGGVCVKDDMGDGVKRGCDVVASAEVGSENGVILEGEIGVKDDMGDGVRRGSDVVAEAEVGSENGVILDGGVCVKNDIGDGVKRGFDIVASDELDSENDVNLEDGVCVKDDMGDGVERGSDVVASAEVGSENGEILEGEICVKDDGVNRDFDISGVDQEMKSGVEKIGAENDSGLLVLHDVSVLVENVGFKGSGDGSGEGEDVGGEGLRSGEDSEYGNSLEEMDGNGVTKNKGEEDDVENYESDDDDEEDEDVGDQSCEYQVGDFVWGKIRSYPWWPGQIYSASDASEYALKLKQKDRFLVAYFGDGSFSWCGPSQLKPFVENFKVMSEQSNSKNFTYAVEAALDEVSKVVELEMTCSCLAEKNGKLEASMASNSGLKVGVLVPVDVGKSFIAKCEPEKLIHSLGNYAETVSMRNMLELTVIKSWLTVYCRAKGGYPLPLYHYPRGIEGLEDQSGNPVKVSAQGPDGEVWLSTPVEAVGSGLDSPNQSLLQKCQEASGDILYQRRKQKSVAELIEDEMRKEESFVNESVSKVVSTEKRQRKDGKEAENQDKTQSALQSGLKRGRRQKAVASRSPRTVGEKIITYGSNGLGEREADEPPPSGELQSKILSGGESEGEEETAKSNRLRERKRSKYLSSPFTNPSQIMKISSFKRDSEAESVRNSRVGERMARVAGQLIGLQSTSNETSQSVPPIGTGNNNAKSGSSSPKTALQKQSKTDNSMHFTACPVQLLSQLQSAAADPSCLIEKSEVEFITENVASFRNKVQQKGEPGSLKRKPDYKSQLIENGSNDQDLKMPRAKKAASGCETMTNNEDEREDTPVAQASEIAKASESNQKSSVDNAKATQLCDNEAAQLGLIREKLNTLTSILESCDGRISVEMKSNLETEIKILLEKVSSMAVTSS